MDHPPLDGTGPDERDLDDPRCPAVGEKLVRTYKGREIEVLVTKDGFKFEDQTFGSISAVARRICGYQVSGPVFFKLGEPKESK